MSIFNFNHTNRSQKDLYNVEKSTANNLLLGFKNRGSIKGVNWDAFIRFDNTKNRQPNINGFQNNILLNALATPVSFSNAQATRLNNGRLLSFNPERFFFAASLKNKIELSSKANLQTKLNYSRSKNKQNFGVDRFTNGFENGYLSNRDVEKQNFGADVTTMFGIRANRYSMFNISSKANFLNENLDYSLFQAENFQNFPFSNPQNITLDTRQLQRNTLRLNHGLTYTLNHDDLRVSFNHNAYVSSVQNNEWLLPSLKLQYNLASILGGYTFDTINLSASVSNSINDASVIYENLSHNSLSISPEDSFSYRAINDLFIDNTLALEQVKSYNLNLNSYFRIGGMRVNINASYFKTLTRGAVFPIYQEGSFKLKNAANINNRGLDIALSTRVRFSNNFRYTPKITFSTHSPKVDRLLDKRTRVPVAGFSTVSQNLIEGQPSGVIVGSAYLRDTNNAIIIGNDGYPLVNPVPQVIGNAIPKYNLGFHNRIVLHNVTLDVLVDIQKGGDVWNGTQNVLNFLGRSQQSAIERQRNNFIFNGITQQGTVNTTPVTFFDLDEGCRRRRYCRWQLH